MCTIYYVYMCIQKKSLFLSPSEIFFLALLLISTWNAITEFINLKVYLVSQLATFTSIKTYEKNNLENCYFIQTNISQGFFLVFNMVFKLLTFLMRLTEIPLISCCDINLLCNTKIVFNDIIRFKWNHF